MSRLDRKLKRRMAKRQMRVIQGEGKRAAQVKVDETGDQFSPLVRFDLSLASFTREYMKLEAARPAEDRLSETDMTLTFLRFAAGAAIAVNADDEQFLKSAEFDQVSEGTKGGDND